MWERLWDGREWKCWVSAYQTDRYTSSWKQGQAWGSSEINTFWESAKNWLPSSNVTGNIHIFQRRKVNRKGPSNKIREESTAPVRKAQFPPLASAFTSWRYNFQYVCTTIMYFVFIDFVRYLVSTGPILLGLYCWAYTAGSLLLGLYCWASTAGPLLLGLYCLASTAGPLLLGLYCWASTAGPLLLGLYCWASTAGPLLLGLYCWASTAGPLLLDLYCWASTAGPLLLGLYCWASTAGPLLLGLTSGCPS